MNKAEPEPYKKKEIYFASALFATKECFFNLELAQRLEQAGYTTFLPQRDGFEFAHLCDDLPSTMSEVEKSKAVATIIYLRDLHHLQDSHICLANLEEPLDPGVLVEITYAKMWGIPCIGYRCESRTPFGHDAEWNFGMHFFPLFQCDHFVNISNQRMDHKEAANAIFDEIARETLKLLKLYPVHQQINNRVDIFDPKWQKDDSHRFLQPTDKLLIMTKELFGPHISAELIIKNYLQVKEQLDELLPQVYKFPSYEPIAKMCKRMENLTIDKEAKVENEVLKKEE